MERTLKLARDSHLNQDKTSRDKKAGTRVWAFTSSFKIRCSSAAVHRVNRKIFQSASNIQHPASTSTRTVARAIPFTCTRIHQRVISFPFKILRTNILTAVRLFRLLSSTISPWNSVSSVASLICDASSRLLIFFCSQSCVSSWWHKRKQRNKIVKLSY